MKFAIFLSIPILFFLFMLEIGLGIWGDTQPNRVLCYDPILGRSYCPNTNGYLKNNQVNSYIEVNADGLLGKNYPIARTPGKLRVAVLGDSFTSGEAVAADKKFVGVWETKLSEIFLPGVEVINFGIGGTGTWQQLQRFHVKVRKYKPDLTVLAFCWCNDVGDNRSQYISKADDRNPLLDEYEINNWTKLQVRRKYFNKWIWNHSNLYQFTRTRYNHLEHFVKRLFLPDYMKATAPPSHLLKEAAYDRQSNELQQSIDRQKKILQNNVLKNDVAKIMKECTMHVQNAQHYFLHQLLLDDLADDRSHLVDPNKVRPLNEKLDQLASEEDYLAAQELIEMARNLKRSEQ